MEPGECAGNETRTAVVGRWGAGSCVGAVLRGGEQIVDEPRSFGRFEQVERSLLVEGHGATLEPVLGLPLAAENVGGPGENLRGPPGPGALIGAERRPGPASVSLKRPGADAEELRVLSRVLEVDEPSDEMDDSGARQPCGNQMMSLEPGLDVQTENRPPAEHFSGSYDGGLGV